MRIGINETWTSRWFRRKDFARTLEQDMKLREAVLRKLPRAGITQVEIERFNQGITVTIHTTRPGMIIGKGGVGVEDLRKALRRELDISEDLRINIEEIRQPELEATSVARNIVEQLEKRVSFRRALKQSVEQVMQAGAGGVKIAVSGRLGGADIARTEWLSAGKLPLHTLRAQIGFARATAFTTYGTIGVKVWIYKGEVFDKEKGQKDS
jgi:small subunit ribosomal protein S3